MNTAISKILYFLFSTVSLINMHNLPQDEQGGRDLNDDIVVNIENINIYITM